MDDRELSVVTSQRRPLLGPAKVSLLVGLAGATLLGCTSKDPKPLPIDGVELLAELPSTSQSFESRFDEVERCMKRKGFSYKAFRFRLPPQPNFSLLAIHNDPAEAARGYGLIETLRSQKDSRTNVAEIRPEERRALLDCEDEYDDKTRYSIFAATYDVAKAASVARKELSSEQAALALTRSWAKCMAANGFQVSAPLKVTATLDTEYSSLVTAEKLESGDSLSEAGLSSLNRFALQVGKADSQCTKPLEKQFQKVESAKFGSWITKNSKLVRKAMSERR